MNVVKASEIIFTIENGENDSPVKVQPAGDESSKYDPLFYCRTCANKDSFFIPIFKGEGLNNQLNEKIVKYLPIQITEDDNLPLQLCFNCASTIIAWDTLIVGCVEAEQKLKALQNETEKSSVSEVVNNPKENEVLPAPVVLDTIDSDDEPLITKKLAAVNNSEKDVSEKEILCNSIEGPVQGEAENNLERFRKIDEEEESDMKHDYSVDWKAIPKSWLDVISCKHCGEISSGRKHLKQHEKRCLRGFKCRICRENFRNRANLDSHMKTCHMREKKVVDDSNKRFACRVCNKKFKFEDNTRSHEKLCGKTISTFKCSVCGKRFETKALADQHSSSHHKSCVCHMCGQSFNKPESLKQHIKSIHDEFKMVCHYCGKEFSRKARLQEHLQHHTGQMDFTCHICGRGSTNSYSFGVHLATHSQETPFKCSFCPRSFKHMKYVYLHERAVHLKLKTGKSHTKPRKPKNVDKRTCPMCNKTFKRESAMLIHKRSVHEGKNAYICKVCGKDFKYTYLLYVHKKKQHFPELCKYVCQFCEKPFPVKTELEKHMRKHTGEKPYVCNLCGKTYSFHGSLNMHMKTQHENNKNFKCDTCDASFNFRSHLTRHMAGHTEKATAEQSSA